MSRKGLAIRSAPSLALLPRGTLDFRERPRSVASSGIEDRRDAVTHCRPLLVAGRVERGAYPRHRTTYNAALFQKSIHLHDIGIAIAHGGKQPFPVRRPGDSPCNERSPLTKVGDPL